MIEDKSVLSDGTKIQKAYVDERLEEKRVEAINKIGVRWLMHPKNFVQKKGSK